MPPLKTIYRIYGVAIAVVVLLAALAGVWLRAELRSADPASWVATEAKLPEDYTVRSSDASFGVKVRVDGQERDGLMTVDESTAKFGLSKDDANRWLPARALRTWSGYEVCLEKNWDGCHAKASVIVRLPILMLAVLAAIAIGLVVELLRTRRRALAQTATT